MLRFLAKKVSAGIGKNENTILPDNTADLASSVTRQSSMTRRVHVARAHSLAHFETWRRHGLAARRCAAQDHLRNHVGRECRRAIHGTDLRLPGLDFFSRDEVGLNQEAYQPDVKAF